MFVKENCLLKQAINGSSQCVFYKPQVYAQFDMDGGRNRRLTFLNNYLAGNIKQPK